MIAQWEKRLSHEMMLAASQALDLHGFESAAGMSVQGTMMMLAASGAGLAQHVNSIAWLQRGLEHLQLCKVLPSSLRSQPYHSTSMTSDGQTLGVTHHSVKDRHVAECQCTMVRPGSKAYSLGEH